jgi:hypothetical protein
MSFNGCPTATATVVAPYAVSLSTKAQVTEPNHVIDQGFTYKVNEWWSVLFDYRYSRFTVDSTANFHVVNGSIAGSVATDGASANQWRIGTHTADFNMTFTPAASLLVRTGVAAQKRRRIARRGYYQSERPRESSRSASGERVLPAFEDLDAARRHRRNNNGRRIRGSRRTPTSAAALCCDSSPPKSSPDDTVIARNRKLLQTDYRARSAATRL